MDVVFDRLADVRGVVMWDGHRVILMEFLRRKRPAHPAVATAALAWGLPRRWTSSPRDRSLEP